MKLALMFLSVFLVALSDQQFQLQRQRLRWSPYSYRQQPFINNYQPSYYDVQDDIPDYRVFRPTMPVTYSQVPMNGTCMDRLHQLLFLEFSLE